MFKEGIIVVILSSESCSLGKASFGRDRKDVKGEGEGDPPVPRFDSAVEKNLTAPMMKHLATLGICPLLAIFYLYIAL